MATHSSVLAWRIPRTKEPGRQATVHGVLKSQTRLSTHVCKIQLRHHEIHSKYTIQCMTKPTEML